MFQRLSKLYAISLGLLLLMLSPAQASPVSTAFTISDVEFNYYELVEAPLTWEDAKTAAEARTYQGVSGHLATMTSLEESNFVTAYLNDLSIVDVVWQAWVGGYQDHSVQDYAEPSGGWRWITGEPWSFSNWVPGEPNDQDGEDFLTVSLDHNCQWNDSHGVNPGYVVEYAVPEPTTLSLLALGGLAMMRRRR